MKMSHIHTEIQMGILNYLSIHPEASAPVEDICSNWLANESVSHNIDQVQTALDRLVDHGELHKRPGSDLYNL
ncbi:hypothetical protein RI844_11240 [Thalassotalea fonticola]|uniref:MarR family transcriptional regulator n=1 Tax=Thalassotalea fonticola TaxID=3065649 RepID=A0ABZ0GJ64_9GAMM|nr:hypothetical protein RI844_11240 [Colwelliaceae bacterium S1-1]